MNDLDFSALLVSRVCHDLVSPLGAVVNGLEVLEDERDAAMRADALKIVASSAAQALARIQFMRIAFGAAGSAGAELDLGEVGRLIEGLFAGGKIGLEWNAANASWPKDWAKLLMNATLLAADCLPRGGVVSVSVDPGRAQPAFKIEAKGPQARVIEEVEHAVRGEASSAQPDARGVQPLLTYKLARGLNAGLTLTAGEGRVELAAG
ncbi:MAG TPA: histidine phosphotransferase family protein [Rhizomicrobium sp.]|jgi:histidine phosphotransferase ChpT|nr:histidine phosphotransferase family protein [Rhizomicrobium sp.]